jgi:hypothetical protein
VEHGELLSKHLAGWQAALASVVFTALVGSPQALHSLQRIQD